METSTWNFALCKRNVPSAPVSNLKDTNLDGFAGVLGMFPYEAALSLPGADTCVLTVPLRVTPEADVLNSLSFINSLGWNGPGV